MGVYERLIELPLPLLFVLSIVLVASIATLAFGVVRLGHRLWPVTPNVEMAGGMLAGLLVPLGFILASVSSDVWTQRDHAKTAVDREALAIAEIVTLTQSIENRVYATSISDALDVYRRTVVTNDWPAMAAGHASPEADAALRTLQEAWFRANRVNGGAPPDGYELSEIGKRLEEAAAARHVRLLIAREHLHPVKLLALLLMMFSTCYVITELNRKSRRETISALALFSFSLGTLLCMIIAFDRPFAGNVAVPPSLTTPIISDHP